MLNCFKNIRPGDKVRIGVVGNSFISKCSLADFPRVEFFDCLVLNAEAVSYLNDINLILWYHIRLPYFNPTTSLSATLSKIIRNYSSGYQTPFTGNDYIFKILKKKD